MKPYTRSIIELFDGKKRYLIPLYQRHYAWRPSPQLELLWEDIERAIDRINTDRSALSRHFMGAIVVSQIKTFGKQVQAFEIIDGQQRLTTFQLLISALRDVAARKASKYAAELQKYLLNDGVMENPNTERYKVWPSLTDRRSFVSLIDPSIDLDEISGKPYDEDGIIRRSTDAHAFFVARIEKHVQFDDGRYDEGRLETLFEALKEGLAIVSIELESGDDPQTIFETLNSRGVDLSQADLLRNFIFQRAKGLGQTSGSLNVDALYTKHWLPLDRAFWHQNASRGRQSSQRLDWMFTDHLSMHVGEIVSVETLFEKYRRWILHDRPFDTIADELRAISATEEIEKRLFDQSRADPVGSFGRFADAFDMSTAMPLVVFLSIETSVSNRLLEALAVLESYILRRDVCGLPTKNYNRFFVGIIGRLRSAAGDEVDELVSYLSTRSLDLDRWPDDAEFREGCVNRDQYKGPRQPRLRYILEAIEQLKRSALSEDVEIRSPLTIEHIMPQSWRAAWSIIEPDNLKLGDSNYPLLVLEAARESAINKLGNLTLLTHSLNATVSNGPFSIKMPAVRAHSSLALNRDLNGNEKWDEAAIAERSESFFTIARKRWMAPKREGATDLNKINTSVLLAQSKIGLPPDGTQCRFNYAGNEFAGFIENGALLIEGLNSQYSTFSAASAAVTSTNRNGWMDWYLLGEGKSWVLADQWRKSRRTKAVGVSEMSGDRREPSNIYNRPGSQDIVALLNQRGAYSESLGINREWLDEQLIGKVEGVENKQAVSFAIMELRDEKGKVDNQGGKNSGSPIGKVWLLGAQEENPADQGTSTEMQRFWAEFLRDLKLDDLEQKIPRPARLGYLGFMLPAPGASSWLTVYRNMKRGDVGVYLSCHKNTAGDYARQAVVDDWDSVKSELLGTAKLIHENGQYLVRDSQTFGRLDQPDVRARAFAWLVERVNTFVSVIRPRVRSATAKFQLNSESGHA